MKNSKKLIAWEKWRCPFGSDMTPEEWGEVMANQQVEEYDEYSEMEFGQQQKPQAAPFRAIYGPLGVIPLTEHTSPGKIFNFWTGHTNFNITDKIKKIIEDVDGVEVLDIFTRYRFRIAVGKMFNEGAVMREINSKIDTHLNGKA